MANDIDFSGVFDVFDGGDTGVEEQEIAEPAEVETEDTDVTDGEEEQEVAEPAREQTPEENAMYANIRREAERKAQEKFRFDSEKAKRDAAAEADAKIKAMGILNPYTGQMLGSMADMQAYAEAMSKEQQESAEARLKESGLSTDEIRAAAMTIPEIREAMGARDRLASLERDAQERQSRQVFEDELKLIQKFDPTVKSYEDLVNNEHRDEMTAMINRGYRISDAFYLANKENLMQKQTEAMRQEAINSARGKDHMEKSNSRGDGGISVPAEVIAEFQAINPGASVDQIRAFMARDEKRTKRK